MKNWFVPGIPLSPRAENIPEISHMWNLHHGIDSGFTFSNWSPATTTGLVNIIQRGYIVLTPLAITAQLLRISPDNIYRIAVFGAFFFSGLGMALFVKKAGFGWKTATIIGLFYLSAPPHLAIGLEGFDFNVYWALVPWFLYCVESFIHENNNVLTHAALLGILFCAGLLIGTTYFFATFPFLLTFIIFKLFISRSKNTFLFLSITGIIFVTLSAGISLPSLVEEPSSWIHEETLRKNLPTIISPQKLIWLFAYRIENHPVTSFEMDGNFPDMSWYLSIPISFFALIGILSLRTYPKTILPVLLFLFLGFPLLLIPPESLKESIKWILLFVPRAQALYDHTFRLFLILVIFQCTLAAVGIERILGFFKQTGKTFLFVLILFLLYIDLYPFHALFKITSNLPPSLQKDLKRISHEYPLDRYYLPFPYKKRLPLYQNEYLSRYITRNRVNSQYLYIPYSGRFSGELFDTMLSGGLEREKISFDAFETLMKWGNVRFIIFLKNVFNYDSVTAQLTQKGYEKKENEYLTLLSYKGESRYVHFSSHFEPVPPENATKPEVWIDAAQKHLSYYEHKQMTKKNKVQTETARLTRVKREIPTVIQLDMTSSNDTLVTISEAYFPGWHVTIDGKRGEIVRSNYAFLGTIVPKGFHAIVFSYHTPWYYWVGLTVSSISFICVVIIFLKGKKWKRASSFRRE